MNHRPWTQAAALTLAAVAALGAWGCPRPSEPAAADGAAVAPPEAGPAPAITCASPVHDFGTVAQGTDVVHTFVVKNTGQGVLKIDRARGG